MSPSVTQLETTLTLVAEDGARRAGRGVSGLLGQDITIRVPNVRMGTRVDACDAVGGPESIVLGAYLSFSGDVTGHVVLLFPEQRALECADLMCGQPVGTTTAIDELTESAIGELGNVVGSGFINALADLNNLILHPSPPTIVHDMAIAMVETVYAEVMMQDGQVIMMDTVFEDRRGQTAGLLILAPDPSTIELISGDAA
jgi:chemotaxis protein CheC